MMIEIRIILALTMFVIASIIDLKERKSYDVVPIGFGISGAALYLFDWQDFEAFDYFALALNLVAMCALIKTKVATGDVFLAMAISVIIPAIGPFPSGLLIWFLGMVSGQISGYLVCYIRNRKELKINPDLFKEFVEESSTLLKFKIHKNNNHNFVTPIEESSLSGKKLKTLDLSDDTIQMKAKMGQFVKPLIPGVPFMTGVFVIMATFSYFKIF